MRDHHHSFSKVFSFFLDFRQQKSNFHFFQPRARWKGEASETMGSKKEQEYSEEEESSENSAGEEVSSDEESESEEDVTAIFKGVDVPDEDSEDDDGDGDDDDSEDNMDGPGDINVSINAKTGTEQCIFDLRNMLAVNSHQIASTSLYNNKTSESSSEENITIPLDKAHNLAVDEKFLLSKATTGCTQLIHALFQLPQEKSDAGPMAVLPHYDEIRLPRKLVRLFFLNL